MKNIKKLLMTLLLIGGIFALSACSTPGSTEVEENDEKAEAITVEHALGQAEVEKNPERVIVFDYATLDSLDAMGIDIIGLPKSNIPTLLEKFNDEQYEDVGTLFEPNFETIYELQPDVIFISSRQAEVYDQLSEIAPTVYFEVDGADYMGSVAENMSILGDMFEQEEFVEEELAKIHTAMEEVHDNVIEDNKNALVVMANDGVISAYGEGSRFGIIHGDFGFTPIDQGIEVSKHGQSITFEYILEKNPQHIFVIDRAAVAGGNSTAKELFNNDLIQQTDAYENDAITYVNSEVWYVASGGINGTNIMIEDITQTLQ